MKTNGYAFISYSSKDHIEAETMRSILNKEGIKTWMAPGDIPAGKRYAQVINLAIKNCSCFILMLTDEAQHSTWVAKETERAVSYNKPIFPVKIKETILNDEFELYLSTDQMVAIKKLDKSNEKLQKLLNSISVCVNTSKSNIDSASKNENDNVVFGIKSNDSTSTEFANYFYFHINFNAREGSIIIVSPESKPDKILKAEITEQIWSDFTIIAQQLLATALGIDNDDVVIKLKNNYPLGIYECAPADDLYNLETNSIIYFSIVCFNTNRNFIHNSAVFQLYENKFEVTFFKNGEFALKFMPKNSTLHDFGVDESKMYELGRHLILFAMRKNELRIAEQIQKKVYADYSGGFYINFI